MKLSQFSYELPKERIAQHPPKVRGQARLLVLERTSGRLSDKKYTDLVDYINPGDVVVLNNTKVIKARLHLLGSDGKQHEVLLTEKHGHEDEKYHHKVVYRGKLVEGMELSAGKTNIRVIGVYEDGTALLESPVSFQKLAEEYGHVPLPPYMKRADTAEDTLRYQTEFAKNPGSVAAPTASLNMTTELISSIEAKGAEVCYLTLHVGLGTFMPIRSDDLTKHKMHSEWFSVPEKTAQAIAKAKASERRVFAVGTTVARTLEFGAEKIILAQAVSGEADIFIYPGYEFKVTDCLLTNFHAPKSTVLMLAAAFARPRGAKDEKTGWKNLHSAYEYALVHDYKFLSYGDSMLIH